MLVRDFDEEARSIHIARAKSGKPRDIALWEEGTRFFTTITAGRAPTDQIFVRADKAEWGPSHQQRPMLAACKAARLTPLGFHQLRHSYASALIRRGAPLIVVAAALGHSDTRMVEKHYGHLRPSHVAAAIRKAAPDFGKAPRSNVTAARR
jgi:integrase